MEIPVEEKWNIDKPLWEKTLQNDTIPGKTLDAF